METAGRVTRIRDRRGIAARVHGLLPVGTLVTGVGVAVLSVASYVHLAIAGHALSTDDMANMSVLWSVVFSLGYGLFLPVEQELTRVVAARRANGLGSGPAWRRGIGLAGLFFGGLAVLLAVGNSTLADRLFAGNVALVLVTAGGLLGVAAASPMRGQAAGAGRFDLYSAQLGLDGILRIILAVALAVAGLHSAVSFGLVLTIAPLLATIALVVPTARTATPGPPATWAELGHGVWPLLISVMLGQLMLNSVIVSARLIAPDQTVLATALLAALVMIRIPALIFGALQASLLSGLAARAASGDRVGFTRMQRHGLLIVTALMAAAALPLVGLGPWLVRVLFAAPDVLTRSDFAVLTVGTWAYLLSLVLGQGVMSIRRHRLQTLAWLAGVAVLLAITVAPGNVLTRLGWAYLAGNATVAGILGAVLLVSVRLHWSGHDQP